MEDTVDEQLANGGYGDSGEVDNSNGEDIEVEEDDAADVDLENANKSQEDGECSLLSFHCRLLMIGIVAKKKSALDSLSALEKCFATLRDKFVDSRVTVRAPY